MSNRYKNILIEKPTGWVGTRPYDQFVDNKVTIPEDIPGYWEKRTPSQVQMDYLNQHDGLIDNSLDIAMLGAPSLISKPIVQGFRFAPELGNLHNIAKNSIDRYKFFVNDEFSIRFSMPPKEAFNMAIRPLIKNIKNVSKGKGIQPVSPYYKESLRPDFLSFSDGIYYPAEVKGGSSHIAIGTANNLYSKYKIDPYKSSFIKNIIKRHEYNHAKWAKRYPNTKNTNIPPSRNLRDISKLDADTLNYLSSPSEISARAREMQYARLVLEKDPGNIEALYELRELRRLTEPFVDNYIKKYPNENGVEILKGMDYLDNLKYTNPKLPKEPVILSRNRGVDEAIKAAKQKGDPRYRTLYEKVMKKASEKDN